MENEIVKEFQSKGRKNYLLGLNLSVHYGGGAGAVRMVEIPSLAFQPSAARQKDADD